LLEQVRVRVENLLRFRCQFGTVEREKHRLEWRVAVDVVERTRRNSFVAQRLGRDHDGVSDRVRGGRPGPPGCPAFCFSPGRGWCWTGDRRFFAATCRQCDYQTTDTDSLKSPSSA